MNKGEQAMPTKKRAVKKKPTKKVTLEEVVARKGTRIVELEKKLARKEMRLVEDEKRIKTLKEQHNKTVNAMDKNHRDKLWNLNKEYGGDIQQRKDQLQCQLETIREQKKRIEAQELAILELRKGKNITPTGHKALRKIRKILDKAGI